MNRYSLGDRSKDLHYGADGSLTLYVSHAPPAAALRSNWLPAPEGRYVVVARVYGPSPAAMNGQWKLPPLVPAQRASESSQ